MEKDESCTRRVSCEIEGGTRKIKGKESEGRGEEREGCREGGIHTTTKESLCTCTPRSMTKERR